MAAITTDAGYAFLAGADPYSDGVVAQEGFEIVHAVLASAQPWRPAFERVIDRLAAQGRPVQALCAVELRSPQARTFEGFADFNAAYHQMLTDHGLLFGGRNPLARTNVVPDPDPPPEVVLHGFSYTVESDTLQRTFVTSGAGELEGDVLDPSAIVRPGDTSEAGLRAKAEHVLATMSARMRLLGVSWQDATTVDVYTAGPYLGVASTVVCPEIGPAAARGVHWFPSRPPVAGLDFEMDVRGVERELVVNLAP